MHERDGAHHVGVVEIGVEPLQLGRQQQPLVHDGLRRQTRDVERAGRIEAALEDAVLGELADDVELALEGAGNGAPSSDVDLPHAWHHRARRVADVGRVDRDVTPSHDALTLLPADGLERRLARGPLVGVRGQEDHPHAVAAPTRHVPAKGEPLALEEAVGELQQDACAVAGVGIAAARTAVGEAAEHLERLLHDRPALVSAKVSDEADATRVVLGARVVETESARGDVCHGGSSPR